MKILLLFLISFSLHAQELKPIPMDFESMLSQARANDPQFQSIIAERLRSRFLVDLNLPSRQILLSVQNEYGFTRNETGTTTLGATLSKEFLETGTGISIGKTLTERPDRDEDLTQLRIEQSLYRNAFGSRIRDLKKNLELQKSVIELQMVEAYEDYVHNLINYYLDLSLAHMNYETARRLHLEGLRLLTNVKDRRQKNVANDTDVKRARLQTALRKEEEIQSRLNLEALSQSILRITGSDDFLVLMPKTVLQFEDRIKNLDQDINEFLDMSRSRLIYDRQVLASDAAVEIAKENLKPSANLLLGFNIDRSTRFGSSINREEAVVGLRVDIPFGDTLNEARIQQASYELLKSKIAKRSFEAAIKESLLVLRNRIHRQKELLALNKEKRDMAAQIVQEQTQRYQVGRVTLEDLMQDRNAQAQYEFSYHSALVTMNKLIVQWLALTDQLVEKLD